MKAAVLRLTAVLAVAMAFTTVSAFGQSTIKRQTFVVPFEFTVGQTVLPAGEYSVNGETQLVRIQSKDGKQHVIALPFRTQKASQSQNESKLTFKRNGDQYYLTQIWLSDGVGRELKRQRNTTDLAQNVTTVEVLSSGR